MATLRRLLRLGIYPKSVMTAYPGEVTACATGLFLLTYWLLTFHRPVGDLVAVFIEDDACYYLQVARNWVDGAGLTFDRLHPTNGFHPLWMLVLYPIFKCFGGREAPFRAMLILSFVMVFVSLLGIAILCRRVKSSFSATLGALAALMLAAKQPLFGMESWLAIMMMVFVLIAAVKNRALVPNKTIQISGHARLGGLIGLLFLARLDCVMILGPLVAWECFSIWRNADEVQKGIKTIVILCLPFTLMMAGYFLWNYENYHAFMPISSALKSSFPHFNNPLPRFTLIRYSIPPLSVAIGAWVTARSRNQDRKGLARIVLALGIGLTLHLLYLELFQAGVFIWYFATQYVALALIAALAIDEFSDLDFARGSLKTFLKVLVFASSLICLLRVCKAFPLTGAVVPSTDYEAAVWARDNTPKDAIFGMSFCGVFGYFSERRVINLDGLINGYEYKSAVEKGEFESFIKNANVSYLVEGMDHWFPPSVVSKNYEEWQFRPFWHKECPPSNYVTVHENQEVYRMRYFGADSEDGRGNIHWLIMWSLLH
jgi:hypothetical protein